jgi:hypothetical protein
MDKQFWLIWSERGNPTMRHQDYIEAAAEANRLAIKHPGTKFYIGLMTHAFVGTTKVEMEYLK